MNYLTSGENCQCQDTRRNAGLVCDRLCERFKKDRVGSLMRRTSSSQTVTIAHASQPQELRHHQV